MHDAGKKGGAMQVDPEPGRQAHGEGREGGNRAGAGRDEPAAGARPEADAAADWEAGGGTPLNPYCGCNPCRCQPVCTCGLELAARETRIEWSEAAGEMIHRVTETWRPRPGARKRKERPGR